MATLIEIENRLQQLVQIAEFLDGAICDHFEPCSIPALRTLRAREVMRASLDSVIAAADAARSDVEATLEIARDHKLID